jgi:type IV protein arginine methyltransferase
LKTISYDSVLTYLLEIYTIIRDAAIRKEYLLYILKKQDGADDDEGDEDENGNIVLKVEDNTAAGSSKAFLSSSLQFIKDSNGQDICLATLPSGEQIGVMMGWETDIS